MSNATTIALAKLIAKDAKKIALAVGSYAVDTTLLVKIKATINKGADYESTPTTSIPLLTVLAITLSKTNKATREATKRAIREAMIEAIEADRKGSDVFAEAREDIAEIMKDVVEITAALPKTTKAGATTIDKKATISVIEATPSIVADNAVTVAA